MKKNILRISIAVLLIAVVAACIFACNKEKVVKESAGTETIYETNSYAKGSVNPFDKYAEGIQKYYQLLAVMGDDPNYADNIEQYMNDAILYGQQLVEYPKIDAEIGKKINHKYLNSLLKTFYLENDSLEILHLARKAEEDVIDQISDKKLQDAYLEIISICKYIKYYGLTTYAAKNWDERVRNCMSWKWYEATGSPISSIKLLDPITYLEWLADCSWFATFKANDTVCQTSAPNTGLHWGD